MRFSRSPMRARSKSSPSSASRYLQSASLSGSLTWRSRRSDNGAAPSGAVSSGGLAGNSAMAYYLMLFAAGFAGSFHCVGMCGGFACALGHDPHGHGATVLRHLLYNAGRLTTYCFLGGLAGTLGQVICTPQGMTVSLVGGSLDVAQRILAIVAGLLMIGMALQFFGLLQGFHRLASGFGSSTLAISLRSLLTARGRAAPLALWGVQRLPAVSPGLCLRCPGGELCRRASRISHHGVVWIGDLPRHVDDGRCWPCSCTGVAATRRVVRR